MLTQEQLQRHKKCFEAAIGKEIPGVIAEISIEEFGCEKETKPSWAIGPFAKNEAMTYKKTARWNDPTGIGWRSGFIFNPSLIEHDGKLYMFYRAAPKKETLCSSIGLAIYDPENGWKDYENNPVIFPEEENEVLSCEDPKVYKLNDLFIMFYIGVSELPARDDPQMLGNMPMEVGCHVKMAVSRDLLHWEKRGQVIPLEISKYWAKSAVIPRNPQGEPVKINGKYLMYVSEGCGGVQHIGYSDDMLTWHFEPQTFLDVSEFGTLYEVACAAVDYGAGEDALLLDFYYRKPDGKNGGGQALFSKTEPFHQLALHQGASLSWGGLIRYQGKLSFAQGWDAEDGTEEMYFYQEA